MEQEAVVTQTTRLEEPQTTSSRYQWMRHYFSRLMGYFFTEDRSPDNGPVVELQRRATWLALALIFQSLSALCYAPEGYQDFSYVLYFLLRFLSFILLLASFIAVWMALRPGTLKQQRQHLHKHPRRWQYIVLALIPILIMISSTILVFYFPPQFSNDGTSLDTNAAELLVQGRNPYTDSSILDVVRHFQIQPNWTTPLRQGQFADRFEYPKLIEFQTIMDSDLKAGNAPEFESRVSYPALAFLTLVPFIWFKDHNILPFYLLCYLLLVAIAWKVARPELRPWVLLLAIANTPMWSSAFSANLDIFCILPLVLAWLQRNHRWRSALFLGLAVASKQIAWFFIPFYALMTWRNYGLTEAVRRLAIAGCTGLAFNLPFILWNPQAWLSGVLAPIADPMFPLGSGLIDLSLIHALPLFPSWVYTILEGSAMLLCLAWYWRVCRKHPEAVMLLAVLPLLFAWRSLPTYFYCIAYPTLVIMVAKALPGRYKVLDRAAAIQLGSGEQTAHSIPATLGTRAAIAIHIAQLFRHVTLPRWLSSPAPWPGQEDDENVVLASKQ